MYQLWGTSTPASESVRMDNEERPVLEFEGFTRMMVSGANTKSELGDQGITEPEELTIDHSDISQTIRSRHIQCG